MTSEKNENGSESRSSSKISKLDVSVADETVGTTGGFLCLSTDTF